MDQKIIANLEKIGLTKQQIEVYTKLLEIGPSQINKIIKYLDIPRVSCYDTLNRLIGKGLVTFVKINKIRNYESISPDKLLELAKENEESAKENRQNIEQILPLIKNIQNKNKEDSDATIYKTKQGIKSIFEDILREKKEMWSLGTGEGFFQMTEYIDLWNKRRKREKIHIKIIFNNDLKNKKMMPIPLAEIKYLPKEFTNNSALFIYGTKVVNIIWSKTCPFAFVINSKEVSESYKNYFNMMWKIAK
jgi:sugar-specific transcriptional regulator TrmB